MERAEAEDSRQRHGASVWLQIAFGGVIGAGVRWFFGEVIPSTDLPWPTLAANLLGCGVLARIGWIGWSDRTRSAVGVGFCGGLTTFAGVAVDTVDLLEAGRWVTGVLWPAFCLLSGLVVYLQFTERRPGTPSQ